MKRLNFLNSTLAMAFVAVLATSLVAQDDRGGRGRGGPGGGRPGGGFGGPGGGGDLTPALLMVEAVREEIDLMPDQVDALTKLREQAAGNRENMDFSRMQNASDEERAKMFAEAGEKRKKADKEMREKLEEVLLPEQLERLDQISLQTRGSMALMDPEVAEKLSITAEQKEKMEELRSKSGERMREVFTSGGGDREKMREAFGKMRKEMDDEALSVLTPEQKAKWDEMKGKSFEMPEGAMGGFGGGGGRGGFGGPGGGGRPGGENGGGERNRRRPSAE